MSIRIENPILRRHLGDALLENLEKGLKDNVKPDDSFLKRYETQVLRALKVIEEINAYAEKRKLKTRFNFVMTDEAVVERMRAAGKESPYLGEIYMGATKTNDDPNSSEIDIYASLSMLELLDDEQLKSALAVGFAHEVAHAPRILERFHEISPLVEKLKILDEKEQGLLMRATRRLGFKFKDHFDAREKLDKLIQSVAEKHGNMTRQDEFMCDDFSAEFTGNRFAVIAVLEKVYRYELAKLEEDRHHIKTQDDRDAWELQAENLLEYRDVPFAHPNHSSRILHQRANIKLLPPAKE